MFDSTLFLLIDSIDGATTHWASVLGQAAEVAADATADAAGAAGDAAGGEATEPEMSPLQRILFGPFVLPLGLFFLFYLTFIAPERRRKAEEAKLMSSLKKSDRVITIGGIHGTVVAVSPESKVVTLKIDEGGNTRIKVNRTAIASVVSAASDTKETKE